MNTFVIVWNTFESSHPYVKAMGYRQSIKLPILLDRPTFDAAFSGSTYEYRIENLIFGMLVMLEPQPTKLVDYCESEFVAGLRYLGETHDDPTCERMLDLAVSFMENEHGSDEAIAIRHVARAYFGLECDAILDH